ncbi:MAG TPA: protease complex subunit PrcB family protein [Candidatus Saccharimonadales bacterium]|nr:protease complex subunit PrcB family protein [Candidatus Saccharimonadales bacterium]
MDAQTEGVWRSAFRRRRLVFISTAVLLTLAALAWYFLRPAAVNSFADCARAGYPVAESYPEVCRTPDGRSFTNPDQTAPSAPPPVNAELQENRPFTTLVSGDSGSPSEKRSLVVKDAVEWRRFWNQIHAHITPTPPLLEIDFKQNMVVAAVMGQRPTGGHSLKITGITETATGLVVHIRETLPGARCVTTQALANPYHLIQTKRSDKPAEFKTETVSRDCGR